MGSISDVTTASAQPEYRYPYGPFGDEREATALISGAAGSPMRFAGEYLDDPSSLYHLRARDYEPMTSTFTANDGVRNLGSATRRAGDR